MVIKEYGENKTLGKFKFIQPVHIRYIRINIVIHIILVRKLCHYQYLSNFISIMV